MGKTKDEDVWVCDHCGKRFYRQPFHIYTKRIGKSIHVFCSYNCRQYVTHILESGDIRGAIAACPYH